MYKIKQVALMLGVSTVDIHSQLIEQREDLQDSIHKNNGITYVDTDGVKKLARYFEQRDSLQEVNRQASEQSFSMETHSLDPTHQMNRTEDTEDASDDPEIRVFQLREKISRLKSQINRIDQEILLKDDAIEHYLQELEARLK